MNNKIQIFQNPQFGQIRICVDEQRKEWFCLSDVCKALEIGNPSQLKKRLQTRGLIINDTPTQNQYGTVVNQPMTYIDEANLYRCIFQSRKTEAEKFQCWVFEEVLPQIRKSGSYSASGMMSAESVMAMMQKPESLMLLCKTIVDLDGKVQELTPKAEYCDEVLDSIDCMTMTQVAKELEMTVHELTRLLIDRHIIYRQSGQYMLYADYAHRGYARNRTHPYRDLFGDLRSSQYLVWTERGRRFIHSILCEN